MMFRKINEHSYRRLAWWEELLHAARKRLPLIIAVLLLSAVAALAVFDRI